MSAELISSYRLALRWSCGIVFAISLLVLIGWLFDIPAFISFLFAPATMKANTALGLILCSMSIWSLSRIQAKEHGHLFANTCAAIAVLTAVLTLAEYILNRDFGIDQLFVRDTSFVSGTSFPGRMSPITAINLFLLGSALLSMESRWGNWLSESLTILVLMIAGVTVIGYAYGVSHLYQIGIYSPIALHEVLAYILLCLGILCARPEHGLVSILSAEGAVGILARRLLPGAIGIPLVLGGLFLSWQRADSYDSAFGIALFALSNMVIFSLLIWQSTWVIYQAQAGRKRAEGAVSASEERFRLIVEAAPSAMIAVDRDGKIDLVNAKAQELFGYRKEELLGRSVEMLVPGRFRSGHPNYRQSFLAQPTSRPMGAGRDLFGLHKDGHEVPIEIGLTPYESSEGQFTLALIVNITERKQTQEKIAYQAYLLENVNDAVIGSDENALIRYWNQGAERIFGWKAEEVLGRSGREILRSEFIDTDRETVLKILAEQGRWRGESILYRKDGSQVILEVSSITLRDASGLITGYVSVNRDISERKRDEDALREREGYAHSLLNLSRRLEQAQTYSEALDAALDQVRTVLGYRNVWTYLLSEDRQSLHLLTTTGELSQMITNDFPTLPIKGDRFLEEIAAGKDIVLVEDARTDPRTNKDIVAQLGNRTIVNVPIVLMDRHLGAFGTGSFGEEGVRVPTSTQLDYLHSLASHMAVTLDRIHLLLERKRAEEQNRFLANLVASVSDAIIAVDLQQNIQSWNIGAEAMYGWKEDEVLGRPAKEILDTDFLETKREVVTKQIMEQGYWAGEVSQLRRDGTRIPTLSSVALYKDSKGKPAGIVAVNRDITDRKHTEEEILKLNTELEQRVAERTAALSQANNLLQMLLDHMPDHIYFKDTHSRFIRNSRSQAQALGLNDPAEAVGKSDFDFFPHAQLSYEKEQEIIRSGKPLVDEEEHVIWPDGRETWVSTTKTPLPDQAGQIIGTFGISRDITERKRAEVALQKAKLELEAANKELEAFSYSVSHDLRAPLRSVDGFSQALLEDYGEMLPPEGRNFLERIRSSAQRMAELIDDLLNLSKVTRASMKLVPVDLSQLVQSIVAELQRTHHERRVNFNITPNLKVRGDPNLLKIVLENLLNNAWKFTSKQEQAEIEFGSKLENDETFYFIRDNGAGFDMAYVGKLFGAFQRLHAMTEFSGTGIGLATVQRIINRHGGRIWAEGAVDQGATFFFTLPALERVRPQAEPIEKDSLDRRVREII